MWKEAAMGRRRTGMKNRPRQLYVTKMTRALRHPLTTRLALEIPVYCSHSRVHQTTHLRLVSGLVHNLRMLDFGDGDGFLARRKKNLSAGTMEHGQASHTISSGERTPNCTSLTFRIGAAEKANW